MQILKFLRHLFLPHESNNHKAKILHSSSLGMIAIFLIGFQMVLNFTGTNFPKVLGYASNISPSEVIRLTNQKRVENGLLPLSENSTLSNAAIAKGNDMFARDYWAHFAPDGTSPWSFFSSFGYKYRYAGENLARDFSDSSSTVTAWMNSPTHRENILNPNYREIGIGVVNGNLSGADTTIVVQFFGTPLTGQAAIPIAKAKEVAVTATLAPKPKPSLIPSPTPVVSQTVNQNLEVASTVRVSPFASTKSLSLGIVGILLLVLSIDLIIIRRKRISRIGGRTIAHLAFLGMILAVILILKAGQII
ncbi:MAG TPA: CAP domain-containing protein [Alphaproteobacteria bacterium]|jgi:hypothetical protein|nr:CAP domain-containing protein [Alphaproteobacteria bacterium]